MSGNTFEQSAHNGPAIREQVCGMPEQISTANAGLCASNQARDLLARVRGWDDEPRLEEIRAFGDAHPAEFFRDVIEPLCDSFLPREAKAYERLMRAWIPAQEPRPATAPPDKTGKVYVLSRVTLGSDIKITSVLLDAAKKRYPEAEIVFVGGQKSAELFAGDPRVQWLRADYPRGGSVQDRLDFLRRLHFEDGIVLDTDSRFTQLGLLLPCPAERYFHFPSRTYRSDSDLPLGALAAKWAEETLGVKASGYIAVGRADLPGKRPFAAVSLGVGGNQTKRIGGNFEVRWLQSLAARFGRIFIDRGAGGEERERVTAAVEQEGGSFEFCDGSFAEFAGVIGACAEYFGYDSAGQHAAAAMGVKATVVFAGAPNEKFRQRWRPEGAPVHIIPADGKTVDQVLEELG